VLVALDIQHALRMHRIVSYGLPGSTKVFYVSHKRHDFRKKVAEHKMRVSIFSTTLSETFFTLRRTDRDMIINIGLHCSSCKVPVILVRF